jgi:hypothetical protein
MPASLNLRGAVYRYLELEIRIVCGRCNTSQRGIELLELIDRGAEKFGRGP